MDPKMQALIDATNKAKARQEERSSARIAKGGPTAWAKVWDAALREYYPECNIAMSGREMNNLKQAVKRGMDQADVVPFLQWCVKDWQLIRTRVLSQSQKKPAGPEYPVMAYIVASISSLYPAFKRGTLAFQLHADIHSRNESLRATEAAEKPVDDKPKLRKLTRPSPARIGMGAVQVPASDGPKKPVIKNKLSLEEAAQRAGLKVWK